MNKVLLSSVNPFIHINGNIAYSRNGSILHGYRLELPEVYTMSDKEFDNIHNVWYKALRSLPNNTIVHKMDIYLKQKFSFQEKANGSFLHEATIRHFNGREYINHYCFLFFIKASSEILNSSKIQNPFKNPLKPEDALKEIQNSDQLKSEVNRTVDFLNQSRYIKAEPIDESEYRYIEHSFFNGFYQDRVTDFDIKNNKVGDKQVGVFSISNINQFGESVRTCREDMQMSDKDWLYHMGLMDNLTFGLDCDHVYNQVLFIKDHYAEKQKIEKQGKDFHGSREFAREYKRDAEKLYEFLDEISDDEKIKLIYGHNNIVFFADSKEHYGHLNDRISSCFREVDMLPYYPSGLNKTNLIVNSFPAFAANIDLDNFFGPIDIQQCLCLFTNVGPYKNDDRGIYFNERLFNIPIRKDVWDKDKKRIKARNFFIVAPTGEGKSVLANHIFRQLYEDNVSIVIVDLGGSYRKLSLLYPGQTAYIRYEDGKPLGLNPFLIDNPEEITAEKIEELTTFIFKIWKKDRLPTDSESVGLKKIIATYYKNVPSGHSFPSFYSFIENNTGSITKLLDLQDRIDLSDLLHICSEFVKDGIYSFLFSESDNSQKLGGKKFIVFELDEVKDNPILLTVMLHLISETIRKVIWSDRETRGVIFFDEFAKMLKFPSVLSSTEYFYQAIRKYEGAVGVVLQSPSQFSDNDTSRSIIDNTQVIYVLENKNGYEAIVERFKLRPHQHVQLNSLRSNFSGNVKYSEIMLFLGKESNVYRLEIAKEALLAYQTEGDEYTDIMRLYNETGDMETAIKKYMKQ